MNRVKKSRICIILAAVMAAVCLCFCLQAGVTAAAAAMPRYTMTFSGTYKNNSWGANGLTTSISNETSYGLKTGSSAGRKEYMSLTLEGSSVSGSATLSNGGYVASTRVTITASLEADISLYCGSRLIASGNTSVSASVSDGEYRVEVFKENGGGAGYTQWGYELELYSYFNIDTTAPVGTIESGGKTVSSGGSVSEDFSFRAADSGSGVAKLEYQEPGSSSWKSYTAGKIISAASERGEYTFRATDHAGNTSVSSVTLEDAHEHRYTAKVTPPTCTTGGYTEYTCTECGDSYIGDRTAALGHDYRSTTSGVSCTAGGTIRFTCSRCGDSYTEDIPATGHSYQSKTVSPTCTSGGYTRHTCTRCGDSYTTNRTQALGHSYTVSSERDPTCTSGSVTVYRCTRCGSTYSDEDSDALGHSYDADVVNPTCTAGGYTVFSCRRCSYSYTGNATVALGHSYKAATTPSSCTMEGYTTYKCTRCGASYTDSPTQATGHSYVAEIVSSTCTERGYTVYTCSKCGDSYRTNETQPLGHTYVISTEGATCTESGVSVYTCTRCGSSYEGGLTAPLGHTYVAEQRPAGCTEEGGTVYTCTRCGDSYNGEPTPPLGHAYISKAVAATCEEGGYVLHTCSRCGDSYQDNETQPLGHNFITEERPPSCTEGSRTVYICQVCGFEKTEETGTYPTGHDYTSTVLHAATCTQAGERKFVCDKCGEEYIETIPATGHTYAITDSTTQDGVTVRTYTCSVCGDTYTQELGDQYEEVASYIEYLFEQYRPYMIWVFLATAGVWSIVMGVCFAIAQKHEEKEKAKRMIFNYLIGLVVIFCILVAAPLLVRGIAALVT